MTVERTRATAGGKRASLTPSKSTAVVLITVSPKGKFSPIMRSYGSCRKAGPLGLRVMKTVTSAVTRL